MVFCLGRTRIGTDETQGGTRGVTEHERDSGAATAGAQIGVFVSKCQSLLLTPGGEATVAVRPDLFTTVLVAARQIPFSAGNL